MMLLLHSVDALHQGKAHRESFAYCLIKSGAMSIRKFINFLEQVVHGFDACMQCLHIMHLC